MGGGRSGILRAAAVALAVLVGVQLLMAEHDHRAPWRGELFCPDSYMRMVRVRDLVTTGDWYDDLSERSNTPFGERLHWTRPLDTLIVAGAVVLGPFTGARALDLAGMLISPVLHVATLFALLWAFAPLLDSRGLFWLGVCFPFQLVLSYQFAAGRPDHHGLLSLALIWAVGFALRLVDEDRPTVLGAWAAAPVALGVWVGVEGLLGALVVIVPLGAAWLMIGKPYARRSLAFSVALSALLALALLCEHPPSRWFNVHYDSLSIVQVAAFTAIAVFWMVVVSVEHRLSSTWSRVGTSTAGALIAGTCLQRVFPELFSGPLAQTDPRLMDLWFRHVRELRPILDPADPVASASKFLMHLGALLLALPWLGRLLATTHGVERRQWGIVALGLALTVPLSLRELRWSAHAQVFLLAPYAALLAAAIAYCRRFALVPRSLAQAGAIGFVLFGLSAAGSALQPRAEDEAPAQDCDWVAMGRHLEIIYGSPQRVATFIFRGPEILYGSRHSVIAGPYHRNAAGMLDVITLFSAADDGEAEAIVRRRGLDLLLIAPSDKEAADYRRAQGSPTSLMRLETDRPPGWLERVDLPEDLAQCFRLYRVRPVTPVNTGS